jgi:hypothetical protein
MPNLRSCRLALALTALAPALLAPAAAATAATKPVVQGTLSRWAAPARNVLGAVTAIDASSGAIVATAAAPKGRYRMALPSGTYILIGRASDLRRGRSRFLSSNVVALGRRGQTVDLPGDPPLRARRAVARAAATGGGSSGSVGIGGIPVTTASGSGMHGGNAIDPLVQGLLPECQRSDERLLDISRQVTEARTREQQLSDDGRTSTRITVDPSAPDRVVTGRVTVDADGKPVVDITITDGRTGAVIDHVRTAGDRDSSVDDVGDLLRRVGHGVGQRDCRPDPVPTPPAPAPAAPAPAPAPVVTPPAPAPSGLITITYSGSEDVTNSLYDGGVVQRFHTDWSESRTATRDGWAVGATPWSFTLLNGTISSRYQSAGGSCSATLSPPAMPDQFYNTTTVFPPPLSGPERRTWYVQTGGVPSWSTFTGSSDPNPSSDCAPDRVYFFEPPEAKSQPGDAFDEQWYAAWAPSVELPDQPSATLPVDFQHTFSSDCGGNETCTLDVDVQSVIALSKG